MRTTIPVSNSQDIINSRDIIERIRELKDRGILDGHDAREYAALTAVQKQCEDRICGWEDGVELISNWYFEDHANALQGDYACVDFDGIDYWIRP